MTKYIFLLLITAFSIFSSCATIEDEVDTPTHEIITISKSFLVNEKWFISEIFTNPPLDFNEDGISSNTLYSVFEEALIISEIEECYMDDYYVFKSDFSDKVILKYGDDLCNKKKNDDDDSEKYDLDPDSQTFNLPSLLKGFSDDDGYLNLYDVSFLQSVEEDLEKVIEAKYEYKKDGINYYCSIFIRN